METEIGQQQLMANNEEHLFQDVSPTRRNVKQLDEREADLRRFLISNSAEVAEFLLVARTYRHLRSAIYSQSD